MGGGHTEPFTRGDDTQPTPSLFSGSFCYNNGTTERKCEKDTETQEGKKTVGGRKGVSERGREREGG